MRKSSGAPDVRGLADCIEAETQSKKTIEYRCTLVTPMYGGGVQARVVDPDMSIRATAIRGQLRYWWRFLHRQRHNAAHPEKPISPEGLFAAERALWGGLGNASNSDDPLAKSKIVVRVMPCDGISPVWIKTQSQGQGRNGKIRFDWESGISDAARYALFPAQGQTDKPGRSVKKEPATLLQCRYAFQLYVAQSQGEHAKDLTEEQWQSVRDALRWWANFGGVGARTRRGLGALQVKQDGKPVAPVSPAELRQAGCTLHLGEATGSDISKAMDAWEVAVGMLKQYRQGSPRRVIRPWPETEAIRQLSGKRLRGNDKVIEIFPRAMLGLPIITHYKDGGPGDNADPEDSTLVPLPADAGFDGTAERMASPLIIRPILVRGKWYPAALLLPADAARTMGVRLSYKTSAGDQQKSFATGEWWDPSHASDIPAMQGQPSDDPLGAFMHRFGDAGKPDAFSHMQEVTLERPTLKLDQKNQSISVLPSGGKQNTITLTGADAEKCLSKLSDYAKARLRDPAKNQFNRLRITLEGSTFISLQEYKE